MGFPGGPHPSWEQTGPCPLAFVMTSPGPFPKPGLGKGKRPQAWGFTWGGRGVGYSLVSSTE